MKCKIPEISWHNRDPVLSVDIQPKSAYESKGYRLATGGTDSHVLIWYLNIGLHADTEIELASDLTRHQRAVNAVKFSPNGELLASGDDESVVFIWKQKSDNDIPCLIENKNDQNQETWITMKVLRGHMEDVYDLSWSPNSLFLVSGSVDNSAIIWDVFKGKSLVILNDHKGFVQGVAWDPMNRYIATLSTDRYLRIFDIQSQRVLHRINKSILPLPKEHEFHGRRMNIFHDDTLQTFFRRLCFTPDGKMLLTPSGVMDFEDSTLSMHTTYGFSCQNLRQPALVLPCPNQYTVAVSCCPMFFSLRPHNAITNPPILLLPYRMIYAVATRSSVYFYDTQQLQPFAIISNIHYTRLTDVTWSSDGRIVLVSSTDGFCSIITFEEGELGEKYEGVVLVADNDISVFAKKIKKQKHKNKSTLKKMGNVSLDEMPPKLEDSKGTCVPEITKVDEEKLEEPKMKNANVLTPTFATNTEIEQFKHSPTKQVKIEYNITTKPECSDQNLKLNDPATNLAKNQIDGSEAVSPEKKNFDATPIAIRRYPQTAITTCHPELEHSSQLILSSQTTSVPIQRPNDDSNFTASNITQILANSSADKNKISGESQSTVGASENSKNEICNSDLSADTVKLDLISNTTMNVTPRRVALRTISTPKIEKKI